MARLVERVERNPHAALKAVERFRVDALRLMNEVQRVRERLNVQPP